MRTKFFNLLFVSALLLLSGCGGGGGGSSSSSGTYTATPSVFINGSVISSIDPTMSLGFVRQMAFDNGYLYIVDSDASDFGTVGHVIKVNSAGTTASYVTAPDGSATSMKWVYAVAISANGSVLTSGTNVGGTTGVINLTYRKNPVITAPNTSYGLAIDGNTLYISDTGGTNNTVVRYDITNPTLPSLITSPTSSVTVANSPQGLAYDNSGYIYVTTNTGGSDGVYRISTSSFTSSLFASSATLFKNPIGIAVRSSPKEIYVINKGTTDTNSSVLKISSDGSTITKFLDGSNTSSMLCAPIGAAINGNILYISNGTCTANSTYAKSVIKVTLDN
jgi:hypothetical protein